MKYWRNESTVTKILYTERGNTVLRKLLMIKFWLQRSNSWLSLANSGMILYLVMERIQPHIPLGFSITKCFPIMYVSGLGLLILMGYIDDYLNCYDREVAILTTRSPYIVEIQGRLSALEDRLSSIEATLSKIEDKLGEKDA